MINPKSIGRMVEIRVKRGVPIIENQFKFMSGQSTTEVIHLVKILLEQCKERERHIVGAV